MAKRKCREDVSGLSREALARSLKKQLPGLQAKHKCGTVDFKVVIKGGKAMLKAVPRHR
ncbi:MAG: MXAN_5187 C-terminal domain-containing protein [Myxococcota bacterium]